MAEEQSAVWISLPFLRAKRPAVRLGKRRNYERILAEGDALAASHEGYSPEAVKKYEEAADLMPGREDAYLKLLDYCARSGRSREGLRIVCLRIDSGTGGIDRSSRVVFRAAELYFAGSAHGGDRCGDYRRAARYFAMTDRREMPEAVYFASLSEALGVTGRQPDWQYIAMLLKRLESVTRGLTPGISRIRNRVLACRVYLANEAAFRAVGVEAGEEAARLLEAACGLTDGPPAACPCPGSPDTRKSLRRGSLSGRRPVRRSVIMRSLLIGSLLALTAARVQAGDDLFREEFAMEEEETYGESAEDSLWERLRAEETESGPEGTPTSGQTMPYEAFEAEADGSSLTDRAGDYASGGEDGFPATDGGAGGFAGEAGGALSGEAMGPLAVLRMEGVRNADGRFYCRGDNCAVRIEAVGERVGLSLRVLFDGEDRTAEAAVREEAESWSAEYGAELVSALFPEDGEHRIGLAAVNAAGEYEQLPFSLAAFGSEGIPMASEGALIRDGEGCFVLDRAPPRCRVSISAEGAARQKVSRRGARYYFNRSFRIRIAYTDENLDPALIEVRRGCVKGGHYDSETTEILSFPEYLPADGAQVLDEVSASGVYRYLAAGCDKAGNPPVPEGGDMGKDGRSRHIVLEKNAPSGRLSVWSGEGEVCSITSGGKASVKKRVLGGESVRILVESDAASGHTPVRIRFALRTTAQPGRKVVKSKRAERGASLSAVLKGRQAFSIESWTLTDLAGNTRTVRAASAKRQALPGFLLDPEPPAVSCASSPPCADAGGEALYGGDVQLSLFAEDGGGGKGGSGLKAVVCELTQGGRSEKRILFESAAEEMAYSWSGRTVVSADSYAGGTVCARILATDFSGNTSFSTYTFAIDVTPPAARLVFREDEVHSGCYFRKERSAWLEVREAHFDASLVYLEGAEKAECGDWEQSGEGGGVWIREVHFPGEGRYRLSLSAADPAGNRAEGALQGTAAGDFVVDRTPPVLSLAGQGNAKRGGKKRYRNEEQKICVLVQDENCGDGGCLRVLQDGRLRQELPFAGGAAEVLLAEDGTYVIEGSAEDLAGNRTEARLVQDLVIDRTAPEIEILGVKADSANADSVEARVEIHDGNPAKRSLRAVLTKDGGAEETAAGKWVKTGSGFELTLPPIAEDGRYCLRAEGRDRAGNAALREISFSVNKRGTVFISGQGEAETLCFRTPVRPSYTLADIDEVKIVSCKVNGEERACDFRDGICTLRDVLAEDGEYVIELQTVDAAGHRCRMTPERIKIDGTPPELRLSGLAKGLGCYFEPVELVLASDDPEAVCDELLLDGEKAGSGETALGGEGIRLRVATFGEHELKVRLRDAAGNLSPERTEHFLITNDPVLRVTGNPIVPAALLVVAGVAAVLLLLRKKLRGGGRGKADESKNNP